MYKAATILNNCDHMIYLGGQDIATAEYISKRTNKTLASIIEQPLKSSYLIERGRKAVYLPGELTETMKKEGMDYGKE
ncbi:MAG: TraM recognition domain-containing protein, partial [Clostridiales bacterium]|nr:TraM recognition domain-containing protein [Clostridiales bacterium]